MRTTTLILCQRQKCTTYKTAMQYKIITFNVYVTLMVIIYVILVFEAQKSAQ